MMKRMRRALSILLVLVFGLWPLTGLMEASDESRLPPCCRRHGAHHCAMAMRLAAMTAEAASGATPMVTAPMTCPMFPGYTNGPLAPSDALAAVGAGLPVLLAQAHSPAASRAAARLSQLRTRAGRGPPISTLS